MMMKMGLERYLYLYLCLYLHPHPHSYYCSFLVVLLQSDRRAAGTMSAGEKDSLENVMKCLKFQCDGRTSCFPALNMGTSCLVFHIFFILFYLPTFFGVEFQNKE